MVNYLALQYAFRFPNTIYYSSIYKCLHTLLLGKKFAGSLKRSGPVLRRYWKEQLLPMSLAPALKEFNSQNEIVLF